MTVERADRARLSLAAGRRIELRATSAPAGEARVVRSEMATRIGPLGLVMTVRNVQAASSNVRDGPAATQVAPQTEVGARATVKRAQATAVGARVSVMAARESVIGARVTVMGAQVIVIGARVTGAQATGVDARVGPMAAQATANGEQARRVLRAHSVAAGRMPSDRDAATGRRDNQRAASVRQIVIVTSGRRRKRRAADDVGPIRPLVPIARSGWTCLRASLLTS